MKILVTMTYYRPFVSGPIIYIENLARELLKRGHKVTVLASRHERGLADEEEIDGVRIVRVPALVRLASGAFMPQLPIIGAWLIDQHDAALVQAPQLEAGCLATLSRTLGRRTIVTYHNDPQLPAGLLNGALAALVRVSGFGAALAANRIVTNTPEYAGRSRLLRRFRRKVEIVPPPVHMHPPAQVAITALRAQYRLEGRTVIGLCGRLSPEKGIEHLLAALPIVREQFPDACIIHAGEMKAIPGESAYREQLLPLMASQRDAWIPVGVLSRSDLPAFYGASDVTVLCSVNRAESLGFVQIESMLSGTPVVASDMPGVRMPVEVTGMGKLVPPGDPRALASAIIEILRDPDRFRRPRAEVEKHFGPEQAAEAYERLLRG